APPVAGAGPAPPVRARAAPRSVAPPAPPPSPSPGLAAGVGRERVDRELGEMPAPDCALVEPLLHFRPGRVEPVLVAWHYEAPPRTRRRRDAVRLRARHRHRLLTQHVVALLEPPQREVEVGRGGRADIDEVRRGRAGELLPAGEQ